MNRKGVVVADTTPLNYLILIGQTDVLHALFGEVLIPEAVLTELRRTPRHLQPCLTGFKPCRTGSGSQR